MAAYEAYAPLSESPPQHLDSLHEHLLAGEDRRWGAVANLDVFFTRLYRYWEERGWASSVSSRALNVLALCFTLALSSLLFLCVDYEALATDCQDAPRFPLGCDDLWAVAVTRSPWQGPWTFLRACAALYVLLFAAYCAFAALHLAVDLRALREVRAFCEGTLGLSDRALRALSWPELLARVVAAQRGTR
ncbi:hypothetical protein H632_c3471p0, partial [Helicosporidium sp. ATCC 50920]